MKRAFTAVLLMLVTACGERAGVTVTDSTGVRIVTSTTPARDSSGAWRVSDTASLRIGDPADSGAALLIGVTGVRMLRDGRVAVVTSEQRSVEYFDRHGRPAGVSVTSPGDFRQVMLVAEAGDSLFLWDLELDRMTVLDPAGRVARTIRFAGQDSTAPYGYAPAARFRDGSMLLAGRIGATLRDSSGVRRAPVPLRRADRDGTIGSAVTSVPGSEQLVVAIGRYVSSMERPFGMRSLTAVRDDRTLVSTGESAEVRVHDGSGRLREIWRIGVDPVAVDSVDRSSQLARQRAQAAQLPDTFAREYLRIIDAAGVPATMPPFDQMLVDDEGNTWLRRDVGIVRRDVSPQQWIVLDPRGRWEASVTTPAAFVVHQVRDGQLAGVWTDRDGQEQVRVYRLERGR